jgi:hypothetical protein
MIYQLLSVVIPGALPFCGRGIEKERGKDVIAII